MTQSYHDLVTYVEALPATKLVPTFRSVRITAEDVLYFLGIEVPPEEAEDFWRKSPPRADKGPRNGSNRPFSVATAKKYGRVILDGEFELTGETMILSESTMILNAQHRFSGLLWARHLWQKAMDDGTLDEKYPRWADRTPYIDVCLVLGIPDKGEVVNKIDTGRNRTNSDVIYRDYNFSDKYTPKDRTVLARIVSQSARLVWGRMNGKTIRSTPQMDQRETMTFVYHHPGIVATVEYVYDLDKDPDDPGCVSRLVPPSVLAGLGYLMMVARTPVGLGKSNPEELDYSLINESRMFIRSLVKGEGLVAGNPILILRNALVALKGVAAKKDRDDRVRLTVSSWNHWVDGRRSGLTMADIRPQPDSDPRIGGLDVAE